MTPLPGMETILRQSLYGNNILGSHLRMVGHRQKQQKEQNTEPSTLCSEVPDMFLFQHEPISPLSWNGTKQC